MGLQLLLSFLGASMLLTLLPGPDNIFVLTESLTKGYKNGIKISMGLSLGVLVHTLAAATGLSFIVQQSVYVFSLIKYAGATYLFYLAVKAVKEKRVDMDLSDEKTAGTEHTFALIRKGFFMNVLNPKVALFFIAFLPQFVDPAGVHVVFQMILLGLVFAIQALILFSVIACLSGSLTKYINNSTFWNIAKWSKIGILAGLGLALVFSKK